MGADNYITKPFNPTILKVKILGILLNRKKLIYYYNCQILLEPTEVTIPNADREVLEKSMKIIEHNLENPQFNVQMLLRKTGMSQSVFYSKIKSLTGLSVIEFIRDVRIKRPAQLLLNSNLRVSEVAMKSRHGRWKVLQKIFYQAL